jgi:hypothetical protein
MKDHSGTGVSPVRFNSHRHPARAAGFAEKKGGS